MTGSIRRYISGIDPGGRMYIIKSDGTAFTQGQKKFIDAAVTRALRAELAAGMHGTYPDEVIETDDNFVREDKHGNKIYVHPLMVSLRRIIRMRGWSYASLSEAIGRNKSLISRYVRGDNEPNLKDAAALFGTLGYRLAAVPIDMLGEVNEMVARYEEEQAKALMQYSMGGDDERQD